jgi:hypothetical protein
LLGTQRVCLAEFLYELRASPNRIAVVSSEDFSLLWKHPQSLAELNEGLRAIGYAPKVLFYLRAQGPYCESMYVERLKQGQVVAADAFLGAVLESGRYCPEGTLQDVQFQYTRLLEPFAREFGPENLIVRIYAPKDRSEIFRDFLGVMNRADAVFAKTPYRLNVSRPQENPSATFAELLGTLHEALLPDEPFVCPPLPQGLAETRFALFQRDEHLRLLERFAADNREIARLHGAGVPFASDADILPADDPHWELVRLQRPIFDDCLARWTGMSRPKV